MSRRLAQILVVVSLPVICILEVVLIIFVHQVAACIALGIWVAFAIYLAHCQRCRNCGRWPHQRWFNDHYCPRCGEPLDD